MTSSQLPALHYSMEYESHICGDSFHTVYLKRVKFRFCIINCLALMASLNPCLSVELLCQSLFTLQLFQKDTVLLISFVMHLPFFNIVRAMRIFIHSYSSSSSSQITDLTAMFIITYTKMLKCVTHFTYTSIFSLTVYSYM